MMEKQKHNYQEYRDELAEKLKEKRSEPDGGRDVAKGYLEAKKETKEYEGAKARKDRVFSEVLKTEKELEKNGAEWIKECSADGGESFENLTNLLKDSYGLGLPFDLEVRAGGGSVDSIKVYDPIEEWRSFGKFKDSGYDLGAAKSEYSRILARLEDALAAFMKNLDLEKLRKVAPRLGYHLKEYRDENAQDFRNSKKSSFNSEEGVRYAIRRNEGYFGHEDTLSGIAKVVDDITGRATHGYGFKGSEEYSEDREKKFNNFMEKFRRADAKKN